MLTAINVKYRFLVLLMILCSSRFGVVNSAIVAFQQQTALIENDDAITEIVGLLVLSNFDRKFNERFWSVFLENKVDLQIGENFPLDSNNRIYSTDLNVSHATGEKMYRILVSIPADSRFDFNPKRWKKTELPKIIEYRVWHVDMIEGKPKGLVKDILLKIAEEIDDNSNRQEPPGRLP